MAHACARSCSEAGCLHPVLSVLPEGRFVCLRHGEGLPDKLVADGTGRAVSVASRIHVKCAARASARGESWQCDMVARMIGKDRTQLCPFHYEQAARQLGAERGPVVCKSRRTCVGRDGAAGGCDTRPSSGWLDQFNCFELLWCTTHKKDGALTDSDIRRGSPAKPIKLIKRVGPTKRVGPIKLIKRVGPIKRRGPVKRCEPAKRCGPVKRRATYFDESSGDETSDACGDDACGDDAGDDAGGDASDAAGGDSSGDESEYKPSGPARAQVDGPAKFQPGLYTTAADFEVERAIAAAQSKSEAIALSASKRISAIQSLKRAHAFAQNNKFGEKSLSDMKTKMSVLDAAETAAGQSLGEYRAGFERLQRALVSLEAATCADNAIEQARFTAKSVTKH